MHDLIIIGGGPAGIAAGVYAARKRLTAVLIAEEIGGQSTVSEGIENWIGTVRIAGHDLAKSFEEHLEAYKDDVLTIVKGDRVTGLVRNEDTSFTVSTRDGQSFSAKAILLASGAARKKLLVPGADTFENKGVTYCASCDGPLFSGMDVAVVGGGNAGLETALQLQAYCNSVSIIHRHKEFKGDQITVEKLLSYPNVKAITNAEPVSVQGEQFVTGLTVRDRESGEETLLPVSGVFVEIGVLPNTDYAQGLVELDSVGRVVTDAKSQRTSHEGIWAAGDCTDELYHQNNIAAGDGVKALEDIYVWLKTRR